MYGYIPTAFICILFIVLFALSAIVHLIQAFKWRVWWAIPTLVIGPLGEVIGWIGRYLSSGSPLEFNYYIIQICCTIISPTFMAAANFIILGLILRILGEQYSMLTPKWYLIIFVTLDVATLVVQSVGGAFASSAPDGQSADNGARIMLWGIVLQLISLSAYVIVGADFIRRYYFNKPFYKVADAPANKTDETLAEKTAEGSSDKTGSQLKDGRTRMERGTKTMLIGLVINSVFLFIRTIYRTTELSEGWNGSIIRNQVLFNVLDGAMIVCATYTINILHPGYLLPHA